MKGSVLRLDRRQWLAAAPALVLAGASLPRASQAAVLPTAASLDAELRSALTAGRALVLMVSLEGCPYCKLVRDSYLAPMREEGQPVVQVDIQQPRRLIDLDGAATTHGQFVQRLGVKTAPTVLFLGRGGKEAAARLVGVPLADFYGYYLEERVRAANRSVA